MVNLPIIECLYDDMTSFANLLPHTVYNFATVDPLISRFFNAYYITGI